MLDTQLCRKVTLTEMHSAYSTWYREVCIARPQNIAQLNSDDSRQLVARSCRFSSCAVAIWSFIFQCHIFSASVLHVGGWESAACLYYKRAGEYEQTESVE